MVIVLFTVQQTQWIHWTCSAVAAEKSLKDRKDTRNLSSLGCSLNYLFI